MRNQINLFMDYAKEKECDLMVARAMLEEEIKSGKRSDITTAELDDVYAFVVDNYNVVVEARKSSDYTIVDELIEVW